MKKLLYTLVLFFPLILFSCASKSEVPENKTEQIQEPQLENPESTQEEEKKDSENEEVVSVEEIILDEIEEPVVIDLEPEDEIEIVEEELSDNLENNPLEEIVFEDTPKIELDNQNENEDSIKTSEIADVSSNTSEISAIEKTNTLAENDSSSIDLESTTEENSLEIEESTDESEIAIEDEDNSIEEEVITPSRSVTLKKMETLDVNYPGTGWFYIGTTDGTRDTISLSKGRKLGSQNSEFQLLANNAGTKILHFYKYDTLTDNYLDDYVEVVISNEKGNPQNHVVAPAYKMPVSKNVKSVKKSESTKTEVSTTIETTESVKTTAIKDEVEEKSDKQIASQTKPVVTEKTNTVEKYSQIENQFNSDDEVESLEVDTVKLLADGKNANTNKQYKVALEKFNQFLEFSTKNRDEALYYKAQILEAPGEFQDIGEALNTYQTLTKNYPASKYWDKANKRIIYIKRFYLEGR